MPILELSAPLYAPEQSRPSAAPLPPRRLAVGTLVRQLLRFGMAGCLNTLIDLLALKKGRENSHPVNGIGMRAPHCVVLAVHHLSVSSTSYPRRLIDLPN